MIDKKSLGQKGGEMVLKALEREGTRIMRKNFRCKQGEIDIIAEKKGVVCFIEVKARSSESFGLPEEAVTIWKQRRLLAAAYVYLEKKKIKSKDLRFDIVSVDLNNENARILKNAFEVNY